MIAIKTKEELEIQSQSGRILAAIVSEIKKIIRPGITTKEIDRKAEELIKQYNVKSAFKGYRRFPGYACISVNQEVVHGIPGHRALITGDIVSVDIGISYRDFFSDTAFTAGVGKIDPELERLINVTEKALYQGVEKAVENNHLSDISFAIQSFVEANNFSIVRDFVGHGIGKSLHEDPEVPNFGLPKSGPLLKEGMVLAIEPMVNMGTWRVKVLDDGWTVVTADGKPSAHFEHTVAITKSGPRILTQ